MIDVIPAAESEYEAALTLLFNRLLPDEQKATIADVLRALQQGRVRVHGLLTARNAGVMTGAILYLVQVDRTAFVWPPRAALGASSQETHNALLQAVIERIEQAGAWIGQCLIDPSWIEDRQSLARNGFVHLTDLRFLVRSLDDTCLGFDSQRPNPETHADVETTVFHPGIDESRFGRLLEQTYAGTRDCPELEGMRTGEEALVSHQMSGDFDPSRWWLYRWQGRDAGILLMNDHPLHDAWEVVYMGVAKECRKHGLGRMMLTAGLSAARAAKRTGMLLAVDCRNECASRLYDELGFVETDRKSVHVYFPQRVSPNRAHR